MGACYAYCNLDRLEFFSVGLCGGPNKQGGIGRGLSARLLGHLLFPPREATAGLLNWAGDRLVILGDDHPVPADLGLPSDFLQHEEVGELLRDRFRDVSGEALVLMIQLEPDELASAARTHDPLFRALALLADSGEARAETWLRRTFGREWRGEHARRLR